MRGKPDAHPFIARWGDMMGSSADYVKTEQASARAEAAPPTAIFRITNFDKSTSRFVKGGWQIIEGVTNPRTRRYFIDRGWMTPEWTVP